MTANNEPEKKMTDLRLGRWQDVLANEECSALICDPPYGGRTHEGHNAGEEQMRDATGQATRTALDYAHWSASDVAEFVEHWSRRTRGWMCCMTSHDLVMPYIEAYERAGRYAFAPVSIIQKRPRLIGDGPSSWTVYMMCARPRDRYHATWGCLPGAYEAPTARDGVAGGKPLALMESIVRDYSKAMDVVCDPFSGAGTTALAAISNGREFIGSEMDPAHHAIAMKRLARGYTPSMFV